jgi:cell division cycle protein 37
LEEQIIDATTEAGQKQLKDIEAAASADKKEEYADPE